MFETLATVLIGVVIGGSACAVIINWPHLGWFVITAVMALDSDATPIPVVSVSGIALYRADLAVGLLVVAALARPGVVAANLRGRGLLLSAFVLVLSFSLFRGLAQYGIGAIVEFRSFAYVIVVVIWVASLEWNENTRVAFRRWVYLSALVAVGVFALGLAAKGLNSSGDVYVDSTGTYRSLRPTIASQAAFMGLAAIYLLLEYIYQRTVSALMLSSVLLLCVLVDQHRSVWVATFFSILACVVVARGSSGVLLRRVVMSGALVGIGAGVSGALSGLVNTLQESVQGATASNSTLIDRTTGWKQLVGQILDGGPASILLGRSFGSGYERIGANGQVQNYIPHNWYISILVRCGIFGLILLICIMVALIRSANRSVHSALLVGLVVFAAVYMLAYSLTWYLAVFPTVALVAGSNIFPQVKNPQTTVRVIDQQSSNGSRRTRVK